MAHVTAEMQELIDYRRSVIEQYILNNDLPYTEEALDYMMQKMGSTPLERLGLVHGEDRYTVYVRHALAVTIMLIELQLPLSAEEEDMLLAASLCHVLPENEILFTRETCPVGFPAEVFRIVDLTTGVEDQTEAERKQTYEKIKLDKLAVMAKLANRGDFVSQLHHQTPHSAHEFINDTRSNYFPMCIYAKEHYPELLGPISILMEKLRTLIAVTEVLLSKYEAQEAQLGKEMIDLMEDNARIRRYIRGLEKEKKRQDTDLIGNK